MSITKRSITRSQQYVAKTLEQSEPISEEPVVEPRVPGRAIEDILFKLPLVSVPIIGTPKEVQRDLDNLVIFAQQHPHSKKNEDNFNQSSPLFSNEVYGFFSTISSVCNGFPLFFS